MNGIMKVSDSKQALVERFLNDLLAFRVLREQKWEKVEEDIQKMNRLGSPTEDYIEPPDEEAVLSLLKLDPDYNFLRTSIENTLPEIKKFADEVHFDLRHKLDWLNFTNPLIGYSALEDAIHSIDSLLSYIKS
jgi:hypothetical protein